MILRSGQAGAGIVRSDRGSLFVKSSDALERIAWEAARVNACIRQELGPRTFDWAFLPEEQSVARSGSLQKTTTRWKTETGSSLLIFIAPTA